MAQSIVKACCAQFRSGLCSCKAIAKLAYYAGNMHLKSQVSTFEGFLFVGPHQIKGHGGAGVSKEVSRSGLESSELSLEGRLDPQATMLRVPPSRSVQGV